MQFVNILKTSDINNFTKPKWEITQKLTNTTDAYEEMGLIPLEILRFSQVFGAFPLRYTEDAKTELRLSFSKKLFYWSLIYSIVVTLTSITAVLYKVFTKELPSSLIVALLSDSLSLSFLTAAVVVSQTRKYNDFLEMYKILERIDKRLQLKLDKSKTKRKVYFTFMYTTTVLALTYVVRSSVIQDYWLNFLYYPLYYTQASLYLQFTFVCSNLSQRFTIINGRIKVQGVKQSQQKHRSTSDGEVESLGQLCALTSCYCELSDAVERTNSFYGVQLLAALFSALVREISSVYLLLRTNALRDLTFLGVQVLWVFTHIAYPVLLVLPANAVLEVSEKTAPIVCCLICRSPRNSQLRKKLKIFLLQLSHYKKGLSVIGLFPVDNEVLTSLASAVTTYLVILLQVRQRTDHSFASTELPFKYHNLTSKSTSV